MGRVVELEKAEGALPVGAARRVELAPIGTRACAARGRPEFLSSTQVSVAGGAKQAVDGLGHDAGVSAVHVEAALVGGDGGVIDADGIERTFVHSLASMS